MLLHPPQILLLRRLVCSTVYPLLFIYATVLFNSSPFFNLIIYWPTFFTAEFKEYLETWTKPGPLEEGAKSLLRLLLLPPLLRPPVDKLND